MKDLGEKVPADTKTNVEAKITAVRESIKSDDAQAIQKATEDLSQVLQQLGAAAYQQSGPTAGTPGEDPQAGPGSSPGDEDVVDGEFHSA